MMTKQEEYSRRRLMWRWLHDLPGPKLEPTIEETLDFFPGVGTSAADIPGVDQLYE